MEKASLIFNKGFNCAQSMLYSYGRGYFKNKELALKLASGFGVGISYHGGVCGAVTGSLMVLGLKFGYSESADLLQKDKALKITKEFFSEFERLNGSVVCSKLLGAEVNTAEGLAYVQENRLFDKTCPALLDSASEILDSLMKKYGDE